MKATLTIQSLSFEFETDGAEGLPDVGTMLMPSLQAALPTPASRLALPTGENGTSHTPHIAHARSAATQPHTVRRASTPKKSARAALDTNTIARQGSPRWDVYPRRMAHRDLCPCRVCKQSITIGQGYADGGLDTLRAHTACIDARATGVATV